MVKDITLGQYFPGNSPIHRLDPRTKLLLALAFIVLTFLVKELVMFVPVILFVGAVVFIARLPLSYLLKSLKATICAMFNDTLRPVVVNVLKKHEFNVLDKYSKFWFKKVSFKIV